MVIIGILEKSCSCGLVSSKHFLVDFSKAVKCETVDIHSEVPRHVETVCLLTHS